MLEGRLEGLNLVGGHVDGRSPCEFAPRRRGCVHLAEDAQALGCELAVVDPDSFLAVTLMRSRLFTSDVWTE